LEKDLQKVASFWQESSKIIFEDTRWRYFWKLSRRYKTKYYLVSL